MIQEKFNQWFIRFDFPDHNGRPYYSSGGELVWNKELKRKIPPNWTVTSLRSYLEIFQNRIQSDQVENRLYVPIEVMPQHRLSFHESVNSEKATSGLCSFSTNDILLSNRRVYFHKVCISPFDGVTRDTVITLRPKNPKNLAFAFEWLFSDHFIKYATINSSGSEQPVLSPSTVMEYKIPQPPDNLDLLYSAQVQNEIELILRIERETRKLTLIRNELLPLLINGQATIEA